jgi:predicted AlkP superfamily phosphohydrolase/phosphomutase
MKNGIYREEWTVVKNYIQFLHAVVYNIEDIEVISFDYELKSGEKNGLDIAQWLLAYYKMKRKKLPKILIHSEHAAGKIRLEQLFKSNGTAI